MGILLGLSNNNNPDETMRLQTQFARKLFAWTLLVLSLFAVLMVVVQQKYEHESRFEVMASRLNSYNEIIESAFTGGRLDALLGDIPSNLRVTIISADGKVLVDTEAKNVDQLESHESRPELQQARFYKHGSQIRESATVGHELLYYATYYSDHYIRTALPFDTDLKGALKASNYYVYVAIFFFFIMVVLVYLLIQRYDKMMSRLRELTREIANNDSKIDLKVTYKELDEVSNELLKILEQKEESRKKVEEAKERLIEHFKLSNIGIALFDNDYCTQFANAHFIQYANMFATTPIVDPSETINIPLLEPVKRFLQEKTEQNSMTLTISHSNKIYEIKTLKSSAGGYEITIEDITKQEKNRLLKQEMTSNITHEIRTPLTSIRGYLETLNFMELSGEKQREFIEKAYKQALCLSDMMTDISLLSKLDEESRPFEFAAVNLHQVTEEVRIAYLTKIAEAGNTFNNYLPEDLEIRGNQSLLYSIIQNLVENSLRYAGSEVEMSLSCYHQDDNYLFLSYYDTGRGVQESQLNRLFERFYRVDQGRTRETGGTGLGLSIVKNAILVHGGQVQARIHKSGGLEILFNLHR